MKCKWLSDDFSEVCVNGECPACADFCPCTNYPEICKYSNFEENRGKWKTLKVEEGKPCATKKGLRIQVNSITIDEKGKLKEICIDFSDLHSRGCGYIKISRDEPFDFREYAEAAE